MNVKLKRLLLPLLRAAAKGGVITFRMRSAASQALFLLGKATSKSKGGRLRRIQKRTSVAHDMLRLREIVFARAAGKCEQCGLSWASCDRGELDHWLSGAGRRVEQQSLETCWALCRGCHWLRTHNEPSAAHWNEQFKIHCDFHGYGFTPHITHVQLKRSAP